MANLLILKLFFILFKFQATDKAKKAIFEKKKKYHETLQKIHQAKEQGVNIGIIAPKKTKIGTFTISGKLLKEASDDGKRTTLQIFS